jgi:uncharacterized RDD family membrane protein YckC
MKTLLKAIAVLALAVMIVGTSVVAVAALSRVRIAPRFGYQQTYYSQRSGNTIVLQDPNFRTREWQQARWESHSVLRIGQDYTLRPTDDARDVHVVFGAETIEGHVYEDAVAIFGPVRLGPTAVVDGNLVVFGDRATIDAGAVVHGDLVVIGGAVDMPVGFAPGGQHIVVGAQALGDRLRSVVPWFVHGLLWARPIVPSLSWIWAVVAVFFLLYLLVNIMLNRPVAASAAAMRTRPLSAFLVGLLVLLLMGPVSVLLALSVIGLAVVPFALCALVVAGLIGKVGVLRWFGESAVAVDDPDSRAQAVRSFAIGFVLLTALYMVPIIGLVTWALASTFGLGGAVLAFMSGLRRENPRPVRPPVPPPPIFVQPAPPVPPPFTPEAQPISYGAPAMSFDASPISPEPQPMSFDAPPQPASASASYAMPSGTADLRGFPHAFFSDRLAAFILDGVIIIIGSQMLNLDLDRRLGSFIILALAYFIVFWAWKGTTMGGIICNLRVIRVDGQPLQFADALARGLSSIFSFAVLGLGCLWILRDPERQTWHDRIAGTYVVKVPKSWPLP